MTQGIKLNISEEELIAMAMKANEETGGKLEKGRLKAREYFMEAIGCKNPWESVGLTWIEFKRKCGFMPSRSAKKLLAQSSRHASMDTIKKGSEERLSWGSIYTKPDNKERYKTILIASDFHDIDADPFAVRLFLLKAKKMQPDVICLNGDIFDMPEFSRFTKDPREYNLGERIGWVHDLLGEIRKACPNSQIDLIEGNHELRIHRHVLEMSPAMADILSTVHGMGVRELLGLDKFEVNYIAKGDLHAFTSAQMKQQANESDKLYWDCLWCRHEPPKKDNISCTTIFGHHHKYIANTHFNPIMGSFQLVQTGGMCKKRVNYADGRIWSQGFMSAIVDTKKKKVILDYTDIGDTGAVMGGKFFERTSKEMAI